MLIRKAMSCGVCLAWISFGGACAQPQWQVVWQDEFDGPDIDPSRWEHMIGDGTAYGLPSGWGNNELQYYTNRIQNSYISGGMLHIVAREERHQGSDYTSARLRTKGRFEFQYGRVEARMRLPGGQGIWPAFWMLPTDSPYGGWAASGEIDVMESVNEPLEVHGTIHFGGPWPNNTHTGGSHAPGVDLSEDFHIYAIDWEPDRLTWYIDGHAYYTVTSDRWWSQNGAGNPRAPFDSPFHMLLNIAVGGNWPGPPDSTTEFPQSLVVDWVRVSEPVQTPYGEEAHGLPGRIEAEDFDEGWAEMAYADSDPGNNGGMYRPETDVDIEQCLEGGFNIGWVRAGEWLEYTVRARFSGAYRLDLRVSSVPGGRCELELDGATLTGEIAVPATGGWQSWQTVSSEPVWIPAGEHVLRFVNLGEDDEPFNLNRIDVRRVKAAPQSIESR